jgi:hypothetical protein
MKNIILGLVVSLVSAAEGAENWIPLATGADGSIFIVNFQWVKPGASEQRIMTLINLPKVARDPRSGILYQSTVNFQIVDCRGKRIADTLTMAYAAKDMKGAPVGKVEMNPPAWSPANIGSANRIVLDAVCR